MTNDSRVVGALMAAGRTFANLWRQLGEIDRVLDRRRVASDCEYAEAAAIVGDSFIARTMTRLGNHLNPAGSHAAAIVAAVRSRLQQLDRWQLVRLGGVAGTTALTVHALFYVILPMRFAPILPAVVWIGAAAFGITLIAAPRAIVAAWDDFKG